MEDLANQVRVVEVIGGVLVLYLVVKYGVHAGTSKGHEQPTSAPPSAAFPPDRPGRFRVSGVDRATRMDTTWYCNADNAANARVKGELEGIVVTGVERA